MYSVFEKPQIKATIFYYDNEYSNDYYPIKIFDVLEKHNMSHPEKYYADSLTNNKYVLYNNNIKNIFVKSYVEKDVFGFDMSSGDTTSENGFWQFNWSYTFYKNLRHSN